MADLLEKINLLWLVDHIGYDGIMHGGGKYYINTISRFDMSKFRVTLCVLRKRDNLTKEFEDRGIAICHLGRGKLDPLTLSDLIKLVKKKKINLIHAHGYGANNFGRLAGIVCRIPTVMHAHDEDTNYPWYQGFVDDLLGPFTKNAIAVSESVKESCLTKRKIKEDKLLVIHNGIPLEKFKIPKTVETENEKKRLEIDLTSKVIGTVTRLRKEKGIEYLLESVPIVLGMFPNTVFVIVGDGPLRRELESLSRQLSIDDRVIFAGFCQDVSAILSIFDIAVFPSITEGSPQALLEAMAMGRPIIATNVGGMKEILEDGETALLVPSKEPKALADGIIYLLRNQHGAKKLGIRAKEDAEKYDINIYVRRLEKYYAQLVSSNS